jgi:hypothetical protein
MRRHFEVNNRSRRQISVRTTGCTSFLIRVSSLILLGLIDDLVRVVRHMMNIEWKVAICIYRY